MSNNKQPVELTEITVSSPVATQGLTMEDRDASIRLLLNSAERGENRGKQRPPSICKVSRILRDHNESSFDPLLVSIGPIHRENKKLEEFERQKECYLNDLLHRFHYSKPKETLLEACLLKVSIPRIRESYSDDVIKNYSDVELARMMVMDGCFILEFCFKHEDGKLPNKMQNKRIAMDLVLLENQVPFIVLQDLFDCLIGKRSLTLSDVLDAYLAPYIKLFFSKEIPTTDVDSDSSYSVLDDHVLGYLHRRYKLHHSIVELRRSSNREERIEKTAFPSIVELDRSGMKFKPHQEDEWSMTILFQSSLFADFKEPTLLLPALVIDDYTELILRNFIAYEQSFPHNRYHFTSYAVAMDTLIDTQDDIAKLAESKVLVNILGSNQEAADMINKICKNIPITDFYYTQAFKQMDKYYNSKWINHITQLKRVYFVDPWKVYALVYTSCVFVITVVQTYYTIKGK